jgi:hypothetical protein
MKNTQGDILTLQLRKHIDSAVTGEKWRWASGRRASSKKRGKSGRVKLYLGPEKLKEDNIIFFSERREI